MEKIILDTSSWTWLTQAGLMKLVFMLTDNIMVPQNVHDETLKGMEKGHRDAFFRDELVKEGKIKIGEVEKDEIEDVKMRSGLREEADASVIALALKEKGFVLTEDFRIFSSCLLYGIPSAKTSDLIIFLVEKKLLNRERALEVLRMMEIRGYNSKAIQEASVILEAMK